MWTLFGCFRTSLDGAEHLLQGLYASLREPLRSMFKAGSQGDRLIDSPKGGSWIKEVTFGTAVLPETNSEFAPGNGWLELLVCFWDGLSSWAILVSGSVDEHFESTGSKIDI